MHSPAGWDAWDRAPRFRKALALAVWTVTMLSLFYLGYLDLDYSARMPAEPQPATGRVYVFHYKNQILYVTAAEQRRHAAATYVFRISWLTSVVTFLMLRRRSSDRAA